MKITRSDIPTDTKFPKLMISKLGTLVLFKKSGIGVVICPGDTVYDVGDYFSDWAMKVFEDYNYTITLSND